MLSAVRDICYINFLRTIKTHRYNKKVHKTRKTSGDRLTDLSERMIQQSCTYQSNGNYCNGELPVLPACSAIGLARSCYLDSSSDRRITVLTETNDSCKLKQLLFQR